jgi:hypothetical protein
MIAKTVDRFANRICLNYLNRTSEGKEGEIERSSQGMMKIILRHALLFTIIGL